MKKKLFSIIMCVLMVMCFMPSMAFANPDGTEANATPTVKQITTSAELVSAIANQQDNETWVLASGTYDVKNTANESNGEYSKTINGDTGFVFPITANNLTITAAEGADVTITSSLVPSNAAGGNWRYQNFITIGSSGVTIKNIKIKANKNDYYHGVNKALELIGGGKNLTLENVTFVPVTEDVGTTFTGSIYFNVANVGTSVLKNVTVGGWINARAVNAGTLTITGLTQDVVGCTYSGKSAYGFAVTGTHSGINVSDYTIKVDKQIDLAKQIFNENLREGTTVVLTDDVTLTSKATINKSVTIDGNGHKITGINNHDESNEYKAYFEVTGGTFNISDVTLTQFGGASGTNSGRAIIKVPSTAASTTVVNATNVNANDFNRSAYDVASGTLNIKGGEIDCTNSNTGNTVLTKGVKIGGDMNKVTAVLDGVTIKNSSTTYEKWATSAVEVYSNSEATIKNVTINNVKYGVWGDNYWYDTKGNVKVTISNSNISASDASVVLYSKENTQGTASIDITSGTYTGEAYITDKTDKDSISIAGGTFSVDPTTYVADGYVATKNNDGTYTVSKKVVYGGGSGGSGSSSSSSASSDSSAVVNTTETKTDSSAAGTTTTTTVPETKATVKAETKTAADGTKTTTATVDTAVATQIVEKAVENKSEEVVVSTATTPVAETAAGTTTEVAIPAETVSQIAEKTTAAVTIESEAAKVTLDQQAVEAVAETAGETGTVSLVVETKAQDANKVEVELKLETSNGTVSDFKGGNVSVTVKLNAALAAKPVTCVYIDDNGNYHKVAGHKNADGTYTFTTKHFSTYAIMAVEEADAVIATQTENVTKLVNDLSLKARSSKTKKGNIKVTLTVDADEIQAIEDLGYTVKYKFYRSTKKSSAYKAKIEGKGKTYTNTSGKKGTKYYYKARVMVYDTEGTLIAKTALKQCKYASRIK